MTCGSCIQLLEENKLLRQVNYQLQKRIEQLEDQVKEIKSYIWKPKQQTENPKPIGPPKNHEPHNRPIPDKINEKKELEMKICPCCNNPLGKPVRKRTRVVEDISEPQPHNTEYTIPYYWCKTCSKQVSPKPVGVIPKCRLGIRVMLFVCFFKFKILLPYNKIAVLLENCFGIRVSEGCLVDGITKFADYLGPQFEQIKQDIKNTDYTNGDTTSWRINGQNKVLWTFVSKWVILLLIRDSKAQGIVYQTLGPKYKGVFGSDSAKEFQDLGCLEDKQFIKWKQQKCWAHVLRRTKKLDSCEGKQLHQTLKALHRLATGKDISTNELLKMLDSVCSNQYTDPKCVGIVKWLNRYRDEWFTFVEHKEIDSTNNTAERGLRPSVVMRKISGGNRSDKGVRNHEIIMSVMGTWDKQSKDFFDEGLKALRTYGG